MEWLQRIISQPLRATLALRYFGFTRIPILFYVSPSIIAYGSDGVVVKVPLRRRTRNHLGSMYLGALAVGADCAAGLLAMQLIKEQPVRISLVFKDFKAEFFRRAEGDVHFTCNQGREISMLVARAATSDERVEMSVKVFAVDEHLATGGFHVTQDELQQDMESLKKWRIDFTTRNVQ